MRVPKMVRNGFYSAFRIWGQSWASNLVLLQYSPFSNLHRCFRFWKASWQVLKSRRKSIDSPCLNTENTGLKEARIKGE
jgi:hypothetical protein